MERSHDHPTDDSFRLLQIGIGLTAFGFFLELFGGWWTGSLALLSDAWHMFIDSWSLGLSFLALFLAKRPISERRSFGLHRMEVLAAFANGLMVTLIAFGILVAAYHRLKNPSPIEGKSLLLVAGIGLAINLTTAFLLHAHAKNDLNIRGAFLHVLGDAVNSVAVIGAALGILWTGNLKIDSWVSFFITSVVLYGSGRLLWEALNTLLEGVPHGMTLAVVEEELRQVSGVESVHDLHVWSICSHLKTLSGHVIVKKDRMAEQKTVLDQLEDRIKHRFGITHTTLQVESEDWPVRK